VKIGLGKAREKEGYFPFTGRCRAAHFFRGVRGQWAFVLESLDPSLTFGPKRTGLISGSKSIFNVQYDISGYEVKTKICFSWMSFRTQILGDIFSGTVIMRIHYGC
jgi:hypothetical protein